MNPFFRGFSDELAKHAGFLDWLFGKKKQPVKAKAPKPGSRPAPKLKVPKKTFVGKDSRSRRALGREGVFGM